jgi:hypothetical protein
LKSGPAASITNQGPADGREVSGPTPMQTCIAVTPLGSNRPCPPMKPLVMMSASASLPPICVTKPRQCSPVSNPGSKNSKLIKSACSEFSSTLTDSGLSGKHLVDQREEDRPGRDMDQPSHAGQGGIHM